MRVRSAMPAQGNAKATSPPAKRAAPLTVRELYRVLCFKFVPHPLRPRDLLKWLKTLLPYSYWSGRRLRRLIERALADPRAGTMLSVTITPPINEPLSRQLYHAFNGLREAIVIPSTPDQRAQPRYLGVAASEVFAPRFQTGQGLGLSGGQTIHAFASSLLLSPENISDLRLYALTRCPPSVFGFTAEGVITDLIARHLWHPLTKERFPQTPFREGILDPSLAHADALDFIFAEVGILQPGELLFDHAQELGFDIAAAKRAGVVAELLGHLFCANGLPPIAPVQPKRWQTISLGLLREMVRSSKTVVLFADGEEKARAVWAIYQAQRAGGLLFNTLVTDESCAKALLRMAQQHNDESDTENLQWRRERMKFWAAHLQFAATPRLEHRKEVAKQLGISRALASELLDESLYGDEGSFPIVRLKVFPPIPEPMPVLELEVALLQTLGLKEARVVEMGRSEWAYFAVGQATAQLLLEWLNEADYFAVGLDGGRAIRVFVEALNLPSSLSQCPHLSELELWALHYRPRRKSLWGAGVNDILDTVAMRCHGTELGKKVRCRPFKGDAVVERLNAIFVSIGAVDEQNRQVLQSSGIFLPNLDKAVGTLFSQPFDATGQPVDGDISQALGSVSLKAVQCAVRQGTPVVGLVANPQRALSALVACRSGLVNCLIADHQTAETLLKLATP